MFCQEEVHIFGVIFLKLMLSPTWRFLHVLMISSKLADACLFLASRFLLFQEYLSLSVYRSSVLKKPYR
jgi:hypothetical protein